MGVKAVQDVAKSADAVTFTLTLGLPSHRGRGRQAQLRVLSDLNPKGWKGGGAA